MPGITRRVFVNPTTEDATLDIGGNSIIIEDMSAGNDSRANRTTLHVDEISGSGIPIVNRTKVQFVERFSRIIIRYNGSATPTNNVTLLVYDTAELDLTLPSA